MGQQGSVNTVSFFVRDLEMSGGFPICVRVMEEASDAFMVHCTFSILNNLHSLSKREGGGGS